MPEGFEINNVKLYDETFWYIFKYLLLYTRLKDLSRKILLYYINNT